MTPPAAAPTVVIVDPHSSGSLYAPRLKMAGYELVAVMTAEHPPAVVVSSFHPEDFDYLLPAWAAGSAGAAGTPDELARRLGGRRIACVLPGTESGVALADALAQRLTPELANVPGLTRARRHKGAMQQALSAAGLPIASFRTCRAPADVEDWLAAHPGIGFVLKPAMSAATDGVTLFEPGADWRPAWDQIYLSTNKLDGVNDEIIVQAFMAGDEYVIDTFSSPEGHSVTDVVRYEKRRSSLGSPQYDYVEFVPPGQARDAGLFDFAYRVLDAVGIRFGLAHLEVMLTEDGPRLVEVGARIAGAGLPLAAVAATGEGPVRRLVRYLAGGTKPDVYRLEVPTAIAFIRIDQAGTVRDLSALAEVRELPSFWWEEIGLAVGQWVEPPPDLFASVRYGRVGLRNSDAGQLARDVARLRQIERGIVVAHGAQR